jgi:hypothetical protein
MNGSEGIKLIFIIGKQIVKAGILSAIPAINNCTAFRFVISVSHHIVYFWF